MVFGFFKKKKLDYDPIDLSVMDLKPGFIFDYDLRDWEVKETNTYDWGGNCFSWDHKITDGKDTFFLGVEEDDELELCLMKPLSLRMLNINPMDEYASRNTLPKQVIADGEIFELDEEAPGYFGSGVEPKEWTEMINYDYISRSDSSRYLCIEQYGEREFEATIGHAIQAYEISRINPA